MHLSRFLIWAPLWGASACATAGPSQAQLTELATEVRALRQEQARLLARVEGMERSRAVREAAAPPSPSAEELPALTVVKLKPKVQPAPKLETRVEVQEPSLEVAEQLSASARPADTDGDGDSAGLNADYEKNLGALRTGDVDGASLRLEQFAVDHPRHSKADNALYFAGLGRMGLSDYRRAADLFERAQKQYPAGDAVPDVMLKLAECRVRLNQKSQARELYVQVSQSYPGTAAANQAEQRLGLLSP